MSGQVWFGRPTMYAKFRTRDKNLVVGQAVGYELASGEVGGTQRRRQRIGTVAAVHDDGTATVVIDGNGGPPKPDAVEVLGLLAAEYDKP